MNSLRADVAPPEGILADQFSRFFLTHSNVKGGFFTMIFQQNLMHLFIRQQNIATFWPTDLPERCTISAAVPLKEGKVLLDIFPPPCKVINARLQDSVQRIVWEGGLQVGWMTFLLPVSKNTALTDWALPVPPPPESPADTVPAHIAALGSGLALRPVCSSFIGPFGCQLRGGVTSFQLEGIASQNPTRFHRNIETLETRFHARIFSWNLFLCLFIKHAPFPRWQGSLDKTIAWTEGRGTGFPSPQLISRAPQGPPLGRGVLTPPQFKQHRQNRPKNGILFWPATAPGRKLFPKMDPNAFLWGLFGVRICRNFQKNLRCKYLKVGRKSDLLFKVFYS